MIAQERLEQALKFLSETDEQHAKLTAGVDYLKDLSKNMKGKKRALVEEATKLENNRSKENLIIDVWRTLEASRRNAKM